MALSLIFFFGGEQGGQQWLGGERGFYGKYGVEEIRLRDRPRWPGFLGEGFDQFARFAGDYIGHQRVHLWIVDRRVNVVAASCLAKIAVELDINFVVLTERGLFGEKSVVGKKAHVAQAERVAGHGKNSGGGNRRCRR